MGIAAALAIIALLAVNAGLLLAKAVARIQAKPERLEVTGVPPVISRADYIRLIESSGFSAKDLQSLEFKRDGIHATAIAVDGAGKRILDGDQLATHQVFVKVVD